MGRLPRAIDEGLIFHAFNRGNNRADVFAEEGDHEAFLQALGQTQSRYGFRLFGYCLMTNHFHLLVQPEPGQSISLGSNQSDADDGGSSSAPRRKRTSCDPSGPPSPRAVRWVTRPGSKTSPSVCTSTSSPGPVDDREN